MKLSEILEFLQKSVKPEIFEAICFECMVQFREAEYSVNEKENVEKEFRHWALNLNTYMHFTSPIRRYADVVVHRQLEKMLKKEKTDYSLEELRKACEIGNRKKKAAADAQKESQDFYFQEYVKRQKNLKTSCVVTRVILDDQFKPSLEYYVPLIQ